MHQKFYSVHQLKLLFISLKNKQTKTKKEITKNFPFALVKMAKNYAKIDRVDSWNAISKQVPLVQNF